MNFGAGRGGVWPFFWVLFCGTGWILVGALLFSLWGCYNWSEDRGEEPGKVTFLDVGQGLAVLLEQEGRFAMYDLGPDSAGVWDSLRGRGVDTLEWAVLSHNHRDHGGSFLEDPKVHIRQLYVGPDTAGGFVRDSVLRVAARLKIPVDTLYRGDELSLGSLTLRVLWPASFLRVGDNGASLVLRGIAGGALPEEGSFRSSTDGTSFLLMGDLDSAGESALLELSPDVKSELLQVGHHGSSGSSSLRFLSRVAPRQAVISVGAHNGYGHPAENVLHKLQYVIDVPTDSSRNSAIARTDLEGTVSYQVIPGVGVLRD